ncbi:MAG: hypothetical protein JSV91_13150 [Phycisphaerales bacterium]|nr:MAG: hypothetical protein JSV91_13150 [Phycisphaerales bacterium]
MAQPLPTDRDQDVRPTGNWLQVVMHRRGHRWVFRWEPGSESALIDHLTTLAAAKDVPFDWFDAIVISHHVTQQSKAALLADFSPTEGAASAASFGA